MVSISRIVRIISNIVSYKLYIRLKEKIFPFLAAILLFSMLSLTLTSFIPSKYVQVALMIVGYVVILFLRDPYKVFIYDYVLSMCSTEEQKKVIMLLQFSNKVLYAAILFGFSRVLLSHTMLAVMFIFIVLSSVALVINIYICVKGIKLRRARLGH